MNMAPTDLNAAPYFADLADAPADAKPAWLTASDGVRVRVVSWGHDAAKGTVLLFPGRTEYVEKYGRAAADLRARGFATITIDWRGQGLAQRLLPTPGIGHVGAFTDYQKDVAALVAHARAINLPEPFFLLAHSMGGCIGLRALVEGLDVRAAAFTAPMWGISMSPALRPIAWALSAISKPLGFSGKLSPGQATETYVANQGFDGNTLTNDPEMFAWMASHAKAQPEMTLGGPSLRWLNEALRETGALNAMPSPDMPCLTFLGTDEAIVDPERIHDRMGRWPKGELAIVPDAQHEVMMEIPSVRADMFDRTCALFNAV